jgi:hypothetical protein
MNKGYKQAAFRLAAAAAVVTVVGHQVQTVSNVEGQFEAASFLAGGDINRTGIIMRVALPDKRITIDGNSINVNGGLSFPVRCNNTYGCTLNVPPTSWGPTFLSGVNRAFSGVNRALRNG